MPFLGPTHTTMMGDVLEICQKAGSQPQSIMEIVREHRGYTRLASFSGVSGHTLAHLKQFFFTVDWHEISLALAGTDGQLQLENFFTLMPMLEHLRLNFAIKRVDYVNVHHHGPGMSTAIT